VTRSGRTTGGNVNPVGPRACYDEGKARRRDAADRRRRGWGLDARIVRIFNTYGPRMASRTAAWVSSFIVQGSRAAR
jgi:UDP-glucuronate decarboxylase